MIDRLLIQSVDSAYMKYLDLARPAHEDYARTWHADYGCFVGQKDPRLSASWNRLPMFLDAFAHEYRKVVWLDADCFVVRPDVSVFDATDDTTPFHMTRVSHTLFDGVAWREPGWDPYQAGCLVANDSARDALAWVWGQRHEPPRPHHFVGYYELNWLQDAVFEQPGLVAQLDSRFDWVAGIHDLEIPREEAVVLGFHGISHADRFDLFAAAFHERYG